MSYIFEQFKPGEEAPKDGEYVEVGEQDNVKVYDRVTLEEGETFPPTDEEGHVYELSNESIGA